jgi:hypothetical protein
VIRPSNPLDVGCLNKTEYIPTIAELRTDISLVQADWQIPLNSTRDNTAAKTEREVRSQVERLKFGLLLCSDGRLGVKDSFWHTLNPMSRITLHFSRYIHELSVVGDDTIVDDNSASTFLHWWDKAATVPQSLQIGMRRLLKAAAERDDPVDVLVDAVVAWENLFGSVPETVFRVTGAMAILLEPEDLAERADILKQLKTIYDHRSKLVHGAIDVGSRSFGLDVVRREAAEALTIGLDAYRRVLNHDELPTIATSEKRASRLLLGF